VKRLAFLVNHFCWRTARNVICLIPSGRQRLYPADILAARFGPTDAVYAWGVFESHATALNEAGFSGATTMLEVGPGRNMGGPLLWWCFIKSLQTGPQIDVSLTLWDVFPNMKIGHWEGVASDLLSVSRPHAVFPDVVRILREVESAHLAPDIRYFVCTAKALSGKTKDKFDLILSHAALEHVWDIASVWRLLAQLTRPDGWHSHWIDLCDHGRRETNYLEMCMWPQWVYWLTMRFIPGAVNRWRAQQHVDFLRRLKFTIVYRKDSLAERLPVPLDWLAVRFRRMGEHQLKIRRTHIIARNTPAL
jgi:SAM-dependent methyltransferase